MAGLGQMREVKGSHGGAGGASGGLRAAGGLKVGTRSVDLGDLLLRREKGRPKRPQRERRNCALRPIRGRLVSDQNNGGGTWFGLHSWGELFYLLSQLIPCLKKGTSSHVKIYPFQPQQRWLSAMWLPPS